MKRPAIHALLGFAALALIGSTATASDRHHTKYYAVTITNLTRAQPFSPPLLVTHPDDIALFEIGEAASDGLALIAQDGNASLLEATLGTIPGVVVEVAGDPIGPGQSLTMYIAARSPHARLSMASMLVNSNDAFTALDAVALPLTRHRVLRRTTVAYDAGAEGNNEDCAYIPGPACDENSGNIDSNIDSVAVVHVHTGIHGLKDLEPSEYDWRNPVAKVSVRRVRGR